MTALLATTFALDWRKPMGRVERFIDSICKYIEVIGGRV
jgi:hypothetical protein